MNLVQVQQNLFLDQDTGATYTREQLEAIAAEQQRPSVGDMLAGLGQNIATKQGVNFVKNQAAKALPEIFSSAPTAAAEPVASAVGGGQILADGTVVGAPSNVTNFLGSATPYLGAAGAALGAKGVYDAIQSGSNRQSSLSGGLSGAGAGLGLAMMGLGPVGWLAGGGALLGAALPQLGLKRKTTGEYQRERTDELRKLGYSDAQLATRFQGPGDKAKWFEIQDQALADPTMIWDSYGMKKAFGNDYLNNMSEFERFAASQYAIDKGLIDTDKGDITLKDPNAVTSGYRAYLDNADLQKRYNDWRAWADQQAAAGQSTMGYFQSHAGGANTWQPIIQMPSAPPPPTGVQQIMNQPVPAMGA